MRILLIACAFIGAAFVLNAEIRVTDSLKSIEEELQKCNDQTLVMLDVGETLIGGKDPILHDGNEKWRRDWFLRNYPNQTKEERAKIAYVLRSNKSVWKLLDANWPNIVAKTQERGANVIALTKMNVHPSLKGLTFSALSHFGIPFKDTLPELASGETFQYANGIIETDEPLKGPVFKEVFAKLSKRPGRVVFVDNRLDQVESVEIVCKELGIPCVGYHLVAFANTPQIDEAVADLQLKTLAEEHRWVPEEKAKELLKFKMLELRLKKLEGR